MFEPVPDWFSWENEGGGIDVAALAGAASPDLVVLMVDAPPGGNRGLLRVGRVLDGDGQVTGGWSAWVDVPDWFSSENQGADVVVADLDGDGRQDVVVAMVDAPPGQNQGYVRVGRGLTADGTVADGWGPWMPVPDWFSWENQGVAIALTPPDAQGARDLIVLAIDDGPQLNRGVYRIGRDLAADGTVSEWTEWRDVPGWFSWANQGCGVAIVDLDRDGGRDLVVFQVDNATGLNQAFYRVGRDLGDDAVVAGGWEPWLGVPGWFSWENQGAGLAVTELDGRRRVLVFEIDAPPGQNSGAYTLLDLDLDPARHGTWEELTFHSGVLAVHAALLPHGTVLFFAGSGSSQVRFRSPLFGDIGAGVPISVVWTPPGNAFSHPPTLRAADARPFDLFCGGDAFLADGRLLSAGGTLDYDPFKGRRDVAVFDPAAETWSFVAPMAHGRWYPTLITLGDGRVLAASGLNENGTDHTRPLETYAPAANAWQAHHIADDFPGLPLYAHLFLLADGRVFFSGGRMDDPLDVEPCVLDLTTDPVGTTPVPDLLDPDFRNQSASVILPPAQAQRVMVVGGGPVGKPDKTDATGAVSIV
ncbi:MAG TPA: hypothetical protein VFY38_12470, partial [Pseudonocardia sp.]|nr:hypothetical protein [Pseudonocardia sp.]